MDRYPLPFHRLFNGSSFYGLTEGRGGGMAGNMGLCRPEDVGAGKKTET
jgi:hypothetical protein